mmetsp:Transcript_107560/g.302802  ORF Transcript_107560/g.302802 Transcript_107560/m.302802 type:complete len:211 (-) Transcript_107560:943-1575(-)
MHRCDVLHHLLLCLPHFLVHVCYDFRVRAHRLFQTMPHVRVILPRLQQVLLPEIVHFLFRRRQLLVGVQRQTLDVFTELPHPIRDPNLHSGHRVVEPRPQIRDPHFMRALGKPFYLEQYAIDFAVRGQLRLCDARHEACASVGSRRQYIGDFLARLVHGHIEGALPTTDRLLHCGFERHRLILHGSIVPELLFVRIDRMQLLLERRVHFV